MNNRFTDFQKTIFYFSSLSVVILSLSIFVEFPYGFYAFIRLITFGTICLLMFDKRNEFFRFLLVVLAILYNPIIPIHLEDRVDWSLINFFFTIPLIIVAETLSVWRILKNGTSDQR